MQKNLPGITNRAHHLDNIRNLYWHLRTIRPGQQAKRRKLYRHIQKQKAVLIADGFDGELLRLYCRQYASLDRAAKARFEAYKQQFENISKKTR